MPCDMNFIVKVEINIKVSEKLAVSDWGVIRCCLGNTFRQDLLDEGYGEI